jgi:hypothetical protein
VERLEDVLHPRLNLILGGGDEVLEHGQRGQPDVVVDAVEAQQESACSGTNKISHLLRV